MKSRTADRLSGLLTRYFQPATPRAYSGGSRSDWNATLGGFGTSDRRVITTPSRTTTFGAAVRGSAAEFRLWAPRAKQVTIRLHGHGDFPMPRDERGINEATLPARAGDRYSYILDGGKPLPDPVSRLLPEGVHGPTEIVDPEAFNWTDHTWRGLDFRDYILYELHVGTFSASGTFDGVIQKLAYLKSLGITALELMPVAAFPGTRNWGYDGVSPYAVQASYGGPEGLKRLVNAAHAAGLAVVLDVVYNHLGPEGNYLGQFAPYFTSRHSTPWGDAINFDAHGCEHVRRYFIENALYWVREYHVDGLRLDAVQMIKDDSPRHIVGDIGRVLHRVGDELGRTVCAVAETDENDGRYLRPPQEGGYGLDGVWSDDFHHAIHTLLTGEGAGYYRDYLGRPELLERILNDGVAFQGEPFQFWEGRSRGTPMHGIPLYRHVICIQNHDQVGNRAQGDRLSALAPRAARKVAAAFLLLAPHTPLLFMGEEYDESRPFQFFTDYGDPAMQNAVSKGRREEFKDFGFIDVPDPQDTATFERSCLAWDTHAAHAEMLEWYRSLIELRKRFVLSAERTCEASWKDGALTMRLPAREPRLLVAAGFKTAAPHPGEGWTRLLSSDEDGYSVAIYKRP